MRLQLSRNVSPAVNLECFKTDLPHIVLLERFYRRSPTLGRCWFSPRVLPLITIENPCGQVFIENQNQVGLHNRTDFAQFWTLQSPKIYLPARSTSTHLFIAHDSTLSVLLLRLSQRRCVDFNILRQLRYRLYFLEPIDFLKCFFLPSYDLLAKWKI